MSFYSVRVFPLSKLEGKRKNCKRMPDLKFKSTHHTDFEFPDMGSL